MEQFYGLVTIHFKIYSSHNVWNCGFKLFMNNIFLISLGVIVHVCPCKDEPCTFYLILGLF